MKCMLCEKGYGRINKEGVRYCTNQTCAFSLKALRKTGVGGDLHSEYTLLRYRVGYSRSGSRIRPDNRYMLKRRCFVYL